MDTDKRWLTTDEAAAYSGYSVHTIRDAAANGDLVGHRRPEATQRGHYRFRVEDLDRWLTKATRRRTHKAAS